MTSRGGKPVREQCSRAGGDCYEAAARLFISLGDTSGVLLVHGEVTGQGKIAGQRYGHAWLEVGAIVIDPSNQRTVCVLREAYYALGEIKVDVVRRYSWRESLEQMARHAHFGPWPEGER